MAQNAVLYEIIPDDPEVNLEAVLEEIKSKLPEGVELKDSRVEPFVFGLKKLKILLIIPESEEMLRKLEDLFKSINGISAEMESLTRL